MKLLKAAQKIIKRQHARIIPGRRKEHFPVAQISEFASAAKLGPIRTADGERFSIALGAANGSWPSVDWVPETDGALYIAGRAGSGKRALMQAVLERSRRRVPGHQAWVFNAHPSGAAILTAEGIHTAGSYWGEPPAAILTAMAKLEGILSERRKSAGTGRPPVMVLIEEVESLHHRVEENFGKTEGERLITLIFELVTLGPSLGVFTLISTLRPAPYVLGGVSLEHFRARVHCLKPSRVHRMLLFGTSPIPEFYEDPRQPGFATDRREALLQLPGELVSLIQVPKDRY